MNKKIISLVLALVMVLGTFTSVFAAETTEKKAEAKKAEAGEKVEKVVGKENKIQYIIDKKFVEGYEDGSYGYDKNIKRSEITRLLVIANGNEDLAKKLQGSMQVYSDVNTAHWANGVITVGTTRPSDANGIAMLAGYPDGSFKPERDVTYAELAKMLVVLVKKDLTPEMVKNAVWASSWMTWAAELGILEDVTIADSNKAANRADAFTMVYNALYQMQEFKRVPANETRGILSDLNNNKLVLNQDSKKEYKITADTVFVEGKGAREQLVKVTTMNNKEFYLGSLVRVLINDKNEVTHILELGNPEKLALNNEPRTVSKNSVWKGVADYTVETYNYGKDFTTLNEKGIQDKIKRESSSYATVKLNDSATKGDKVVFHNIKNVNTDNNTVELKVTDKTEVYVANPYNNQMREVKDINEALSLIGFHGYGDSYAIPNVYAGFDTDGLDVVNKAIKHDSDRNTAKVLVFNIVSKDKGGDVYRVIESSSSRFSTTLEDTDGKLYDRDNKLDTDRFPLEYGDKLDLIELFSATDSRLKTVLDHSDTKLFPIVEVTAKDGDKSLTIEDKNGERSFLDIRDTDIFSAKRFDDLRVGSKIQFVVKNTDSNVAKYVSILARDTKLAGSMVGVLPTEFAGTTIGTVKSVEVTENGRSTVTMYVYNENFDAGEKYTRKTFNVTDEVAKALEEYAGTDTEFRFNVQKDMGWAGNYKASDFVFNKTNKPLDVNAPETEANPIEKLEAEAKNGLATNEELQKATDYVTKNANTTAEKEALDKRINDALKANVEKLMKDYKDAVAKYDILGNKATELSQKVTDAINLLNNRDNTAKDNYTEELAKATKDAKNAVFTEYVNKVKAVKVEDFKTTTDDVDEAALKAEVQNALDKVKKPGLLPNASATAQEIAEAVVGANTVTVEVKAEDEAVLNGTQNVELTVNVVK